MLFSASDLCTVAETMRIQSPYPAVLKQGVWLFCVSGGPAMVDGESFLPQMLPAGSLLLAPAGVQIVPAGSALLAGIRLAGTAVQPLAAALHRPLVQHGAALPGMAGAVLHLCETKGTAAEAFSVLYRLEHFDETQAALSSLAAQAVAAIRENYASLYGVEELAQTLGVSKSHLVRSFKTALGVTPGAYLTDVRLEAARQLLCSTDCSLELVAQMCGFSGASYFVRVFREKNGCTPARFRAERGLPSGTHFMKDEMYL